MKKKIGIIILTLIFNISLISCGGAQLTDEERAFQAYSHYLDLIGENGSGAWSANFVMDMEVDFWGMTISTISEGTSAAIITDENNMELLTDMSTDMGLLGSTNMIMYMLMTDGEVEMSIFMDGQEISDLGLDSEMFEDMMESSTNIPVFTIEDMTSVEIEENGNYTTFHLVLDISALSDFIEEFMDGQMGEMMDMFDDGMDVSMSFGDEMLVSLTVYDNDKNPVSIIMTMEMTMAFDGSEFEDMDGEEISIHMVIEYNYTAFGDDVVIVRP